jgi:uncharacterized membrane protein
MQNPPPGPPPGGQPPSYPPPGGPQPGYQPATGGVDKKTGAILSYVLGWITGLIFLFVGKNDPDVKYHGAQSLVFFGGMTVIIWVLQILGSFTPGVIRAIFGIVVFLLSVFAFVVWIMCLVRAASGNGQRFQIPVVGNYVTPYAEQIANAVN